MPLRPTLSMLVLVALSVSPTVRLSAQSDPDRAVAGGGGVPSGYHARTDRNAAMTNVKVATMGTGMHFTLGPAVIVWRDADAATGDYHVVASFTQTKAPTHPEAYGLFIGGAGAPRPPPRDNYLSLPRARQVLLQPPLPRLTPAPE